eukprot:25635-Amphidinium_carterae.1
MESEPMTTSVLHASVLPVVALAPPNGVRAIAISKESCHCVVPIEAFAPLNGVRAIAQEFALSRASLHSVVPVVAHAPLESAIPRLPLKD